MKKMSTISAKVTIEEKIRFQQIAKEKNTSVSDLIKQAIKMGKRIDVNELERLEELNRIGNYIHKISEYCVSSGVIDEHVLLALKRIEYACKNI